MLMEIHIYLNISKYQWIFTDLSILCDITVVFHSFYTYYIMWLNVFIFFLRTSFEYYPLPHTTPSPHTISCSFSLLQSKQNIRIAQDKWSPICVGQKLPSMGSAQEFGWEPKWQNVKKIDIPLPRSHQLQITVWLIEISVFISSCGGI